MSAGDVVLIPAGMPHWYKDVEGTVTYLEVRFEGGTSSAGWDAPELAPWLEKALDTASQRHFGKPSMFMGG